MKSDIVNHARSQNKLYTITITMGKFLKLVTLFLFGATVPFLFARYGVRVKPENYSFLENLSFAFAGGGLALVLFALGNSNTEKSWRELIGLASVFLGLLSAVLSFSG